MRLCTTSAQFYFRPVSRSFKKRVTFAEGQNSCGKIGDALPIFPIRVRPFLDFFLVKKVLWERLDGKKSSGILQNKNPEKWHISKPSNPKKPSKMPFSDIFGDFEKVTIFGGFFGSPIFLKFPQIWWISSNLTNFIDFASFFDFLDFLDFPHFLRFCLLFRFSGFSRFWPIFVDFDLFYLFLMLLGRRPP